jgi:putative component of membrane protein insertase Oxa1/YidC/SpoIIIJ protein YidD
MIQALKEHGLWWPLGLKRIVRAAIHGEKTGHDPVPKKIINY